MPVSVDELIEQVSEEDALAQILAILDSLGFTATSWQSGSIPRTICEMVARLYSDATGLIVNLTSGGFNDLAAGDYLTLFSDSHYDNQRVEAVKTQGYLRLTTASGQGPHAVAVGDLVAAVGADGVTYRCIAGGTLTDAAPVLLLFEAETAGISGNAADGTITTLKTPLAGVTITNLTGWQTQAGVDQETDARLRQRNRTKWATLGYSGPADAYENWALEASPSVTRVFVDDTNARGAGLVDIYIAGDDGPISPDITGDVEDYINGTVDGVGRNPLTATPDVLNATALPFTVDFTVYYDPAYDGAEVSAAVEAAMLAYVQSVPIGGTGDTGKLLLSGLYHAALGIEGAVNVAFTAPVADVTLADSEVAVPTFVAQTPQPI
jgi:uncharacterized phage protein gp47/JayE